MCKDNKLSHTGTKMSVGNVLQLQSLGKWQCNHIHWKSRRGTLQQRQELWIPFFLVAIPFSFHKEHPKFSKRRTWSIFVFCEFVPKKTLSALNVRTASLLSTETYRFRAVTYKTNQQTRRATAHTRHIQRKREVVRRAGWSGPLGGGGVRSFRSLLTLSQTLKKGHGLLPNATLSQPERFCIIKTGSNDCHFTVSLTARGKVTRPCR